MFHGGDHENLIAGNLNLGLDGGTEISIRADQVAVIQFVGGRPAVSERERLPAGNCR